MIAKLSEPAVILGIMSGTSLDGLDLALCEFSTAGEETKFKILSATTVHYTEEWKNKLTNVKTGTAEEYFRADAHYGAYIAENVIRFLEGSNTLPLAIASHGHTVFHRPAAGFSTQIGSGATIAALTGFPTICDFRSLDVALKGQGAPLVPVGDALLFKEYEACLNIGGIANISFNAEDGRKAYDICVANMLLNYLAEKTGQPFDNEGTLASAGTVNADLLRQLNELPYYQKEGAKSLGREWFEGVLLPLLDQSQNINDLLATCTEHVAFQIAEDLVRNGIKRVLVTGGGAFNSFLIKRIQKQTECKIVVPDGDIINFKEALIFAFLGYLRLSQKTNTLSSVTGAVRDSVGGAVYFG